ncbi:MAG: YceI family protein [Chloroflexota bacterium]
MRGNLSSMGSSIGRSCARALLASRDFTRPASGQAAASGRAGRAVLTTAIAASLLLPFSGSGAPVASAAVQNPADTVIRPAQADGLTRFSLIPGENEARYIMTIQTLGQAPKQAACTTRDVSGEIVMGADGAIISELSKIVVDQRTLQCASPLRNPQAQNLLETKTHPLAEFVVSSAPGLGMPLPEGETAFQLVGDQTVRGQSQPTVYDTLATVTPEGMVGTARSTLKMTSFGITPPSIGPLLQVSDDMIAEVDLKTTVGTAMAGAPATEPTAADPGAPAEGEAP